MPSTRRARRGAGAVHGKPLHCVMFCHVPHAAAEALRFRSCISFLRRVPFRSMPSAPPPAWAPASGGTRFLRAYPACAPVPARARLAPARFARLIARARRRAHLRSASGKRRDAGDPAAFPSPSFARGNGAVHGRPPASCHELSCSPCRRRSSAVPFLHIVPFLTLRSAPVRPPPPAWAPASGGTRFLRAYPACAPAPARARLAPARFAHLIARASRRAHVSCPFPPGLFSGPSPCFPLQKSEKAALGSRLSTLIIHRFLSSQAFWREKYENFSNFLPKAERRAGGSHGWTPASAGQARRGAGRGRAGGRDRYRPEGDMCVR